MFPSITSFPVARTPIARVLTNGETCFTVYGDIQIISLVSECISTGTPAATTVQWQANPTVGAAATFTGASGSLVTAVAGSSLSVISGQAVAPSLIVSGANNTAANPLAVWCQSGTIKSVVGTGPSTGTWAHYLAYIPLEPGAYVIAN